VHRGRHLAQLLLSGLAVVLAFGAAMYRHREALGRVCTGEERIEGACRAKVQRFVRLRRPRRPLVVLFGDSLNACGERTQQVENRVGRVLDMSLRDGGREANVLDLSVPGFRPLHYYSLLEETLGARPRMVIAELNLNALAPRAPGARAGFLPHFIRRLRLRDVAALRGALAADGFSVLDPAWMRVKHRLGLLCAVDGLRSAVRGRVHLAGWSATRALGLAPRPPNRIERRPDAGRPPDAYAAHPSVATLRALRAQARASGARLVFYVAPLHPDRRDDRNPVAAAALRAEIERLRIAIGAVEEEWLDLHDAVPRALFLDRFGHLRNAGCTIVGRSVAGRVLPALAW